MKKLLTLILFLFLLSTKANAICLPCDPCWISGVGGPMTDLGGVGDMIMKGTAEAQKQANYIKQQTEAMWDKAVSLLPDMSFLTNLFDTKTEIPVVEDKNGEFFEELK